MAKARKANWSSSETVCLVDQCVTNHDELNGKFGDGVTSSSKDQFWKDTCEKVNSFGFCNRTVEEAQKKWKDIKSQTKKKEQKRRRYMRETGGGGESEDTLKNWEQKIINIMPTAVLEGLHGGVDTFREETPEALPKETTQTQVGDNVIIHPENVQVEVETSDPEPKEKDAMTCKRRRTANELVQIQYQFFAEQIKTTKEKRLNLVAKRRLYAVKEKFFTAATAQLEQNGMQGLLNIFGEE